VYIDLYKTLEKIREKFPKDKPVAFKMLQQAYAHAMHLRSQILSLMYDMVEFGSGKKADLLEGVSSQTENKSLIKLVIPEPLPAKKELSGVLEKHWVNMIHEAIAQESQTGIPRFEKAFVMIRIYAARGSRNYQVWDTSNRAINVVINNLKGIFFDDDNFEHMACCIIADWGEPGRTEIRICELEDLKKCEIFC
jgi:hypothetical protein